ncbi:MAG: hypothetical protein A2639_01745 [Candidatus Staskawiczbacteria bacterium RIFCSPHIGHO2_01_FULL_34_27]|uniref:EamA domain-containing protein n=2 Tax=Candidatus Staskawicziibacteriota TaxID=1817916 RepID=A0A1G2HLJ6_9BACT|nr:MAG: hypothetical protein UR31_C0011G0007 [Parcubacteria group bacterium GW2011_GWA2_33_14]OGZ63372.1 MAG: hypothetical protein A2639_01745 [Candidatus Staskawiczbacteria bacterium RIFCSPHIGHO2_01_FULL_34_27]OGZ65855.1 MAG: hypothetical protein A3D34_03355 [Candidatus Staskawiczbacteria bacterium RIFCSPHIGHO2_02_FULL_33_16]OGZ70511.1 MAG: hypothetical protein A2980_00995 [Candidatus Staskawiczbacteria bacterium RIFCSPLOWO2_01_FULL_33_13]
MNIFYQFLFIFVTTGFFVACNVITAQWAKTGQNLLWIPVFVCAMIGYILFGLLIKQTNLAVSSGLVDALLVVLSISIGIFILKDAVNTQQIVGLVLACLAVILMI